MSAGLARAVRLTRNEMSILINAIAWFETDCQTEITQRRKLSRLRDRLVRERGLTFVPVSASAGTQRRDEKGSFAT